MPSKIFLIEKFDELYSSEEIYSKNFGKKKINHIFSNKQLNKL